MDVMDLRRNIMLNEPHIATSTGNPVSFNTDMKGLMNQVKAEFSPVQSGTGDPSPENVRPITGWNGVTVNHSGKNMANIDSNKIITVTIGSNNRSAILTGIKNCTVTISASIKTEDDFPLGNINVGKYSNGSVSSSSIQTIAQSNGYTYTRKIVLSENQELAITYGANNSSNFSASLAKCNIQIELGETESTYEAYTGTTIPVTFPAQGKNLLDPATLAHGSINESGNEAVNSARVRGGFIPVVPGKTYTVSATGFIALMHLYDANKASISGNMLGTDRTMPENAAFARCLFRNSENTDIVPSDITDAIFAEGSTAQPYEPYTNTIYGGYVDLTAGELVVTHKLFTMDENISTPSLSRIDPRRFDISIESWGITTASNCDMFTQVGGLSTLPFGSYMIWKGSSLVIFDSD